MSSNNNNNNNNNDQSIEMSTVTDIKPQQQQQQQQTTPSYLPPPSRTRVFSPSPVMIQMDKNQKQHEQQHEQQQVFTATSTKASLFSRYRIPFTILISVLVTLAILAVILIPIMILVVGKNQAQSSADALIFQFNAIGLSNPTENELMFKASVSMNSAGGYDTVIKPFRVVASYQGKTFGTLTMPRVNTKANLPTDFLISSSLQLSDTSVFHEIALALMSGQTVEWTISGTPRVHVKMGGISATYSVSISKSISITGAVLESLMASNINTLNGTSTTLTTNLTQTIYNPSIISLVDLEGVSFDLMYDSVKIGTVSMPTFSVLQGMNTIQNCQAVFTRTNDSDSSLTTFLNNWTLGLNQTLSIVGPTTIGNGDSTYLLNTIANKVLIVGNTQPRLVSNATLPVLELVESFMSTGVLALGVNVTLVNPLGVDVVQESMSFSVDLETPLPGFIARLPFGPSLTAPEANQTFLYIECEEGTSLPTISSASSSSNVTVPAHSSVNYQFTSISFTDLCQVTRLLGLYYALATNTNNNTNLPQSLTLSVSTGGKMTSVLASSFSTDINYSQQNIPFNLGVTESTLNLVKLVINMLNIKYEWLLPGGI